MRVHRLEWDGRDAAEYAAQLRALSPPAGKVADAVGEVLRAVREGGDGALVELIERHDGVKVEAGRLRVEPAEVEAAAGRVDPRVRDALTLAAQNIRIVAEAQLTDEVARVELPQGHTVAVREAPVGAAGLYVPGGRAVYPSTVLMCCVPAVLAGVDRVAVASPPGPHGRPNDAVLAACSIAGADEVYAIGGAQAIAALAYGTESVAPVDLIAGPGSRYVQEAKRQVTGKVGIDGIEGPSELMVVLDGDANVEWAALDLCAQAEHGADGLLVGASADGGALDLLEERVRALAGERPSISEPALALVRVSDTEAATALAESLAPEHLQLMYEGADMTAPVRTAGCVLVGPQTATAFGDYVAGSNHVLPTGGAGRFSGPLGPGVFRRKITVVSVPPEAAARLAPHVEALAEVEGFPVHAESARARSEG